MHSTKIEVGPTDARESEKTHELAEIASQVDFGEGSLSDLRADVNVVHVQVEVTVIEAEGIFL